jgi:histidyl-tRNA synthetase
MVTQFLAQLGLGNIALLLNSLGCPVCRPGYRERLLAWLDSRQAELCEDCRRRLTVNPLRVLDCKLSSCRQISQDAPHLTESLCRQCRLHFDQVGELLNRAGVGFTLEPRLVRGLDYYQRTTFEIICGELGAQNAVAGGGRYDSLIAQLGGPEQPGLGFAIGLERLALLLPPAQEESPELMVAALGSAAYERLFPLVMAMRRENRRIDLPAPGKSLKSLMRQADKLKTRWVAIVGERELAEEKITIKDLQSGDQTVIRLEQLPSYRILAIID